MSGSAGEPGPVRLGYMPQPPGCKHREAARWQFAAGASLVLWLLAISVPVGIAVVLIVRTLFAVLVG